MGLAPSRHLFFSSVSKMATTTKAKEVVEVQKRRRSDGGATEHRSPRKRNEVGEAPHAVQRPRKRGSEKVIRKVRERNRPLTIASCTSPHPITTSFLAPHSSFIWYDEDTWTEVAKYLDGKSLMSLGLANHWFYRLIMEDSIWRYAYLRDLQVPLSQRPSPFQWSSLYASAFDGSHSYKFRQPERHIGDICQQIPEILILLAYNRLLTGEMCLGIRLDEDRRVLPRLSLGAADGDAGATKSAREIRSDAERGIRWGGGVHEDLTAADHLLAALIFKASSRAVLENRAYLNSAPFAPFACFSEVDL
ncbi:hypothetical protein J5N97_007702 [Dioscorea zingiberensis]|uniref:F-box domain-containing protein n=1 Tax=Dioscorea zingiberensis TaxID=325984 RepID=A0A9D5DCE1_9LILI|nr:hypothetical protein J5N97_007702 [Dioscorea zingiberensis]